MLSSSYGKKGKAKKISRRDSRSGCLMRNLVRERKSARKALKGLSSEIWKAAKLKTPDYRTKYKKRYWQIAALGSILTLHRKKTDTSNKHRGKDQN